MQCIQRSNIIILIFLFLISKATNTFSEEKFKIITTFTIIADMAKNVAGNAAEVVSITKPGAEIHEYQPTPKDIKRAQGAKLILKNNMNLETWFQRFYHYFDNVPEIIVTKGIIPIGITEGPYNGKPNPHAWMSPNNALIYVDNIRDALVQYDSIHKNIYMHNAEIYKNNIINTIEPLRKKVSQIPKNQRWLVSSEGAFSYMVKDLGLKELYLWPINADQQGTPQQIRKVIDTIKKNHIPTIFSESTVSKKPALQVARESGSHYGGVLYVDSLTTKDGLVPTYIDLLNVTTHTLVKGIQDGMKE